jgi:hypothetical protein
MKFIKNYIIYTVYLLFLIVIIDLVLSFSLEYLFFPIYNWFNGLGIVLKILILILGIGLFKGLMDLIGFIGAFLVTLSDRAFKFELNTFQSIFSTILFFANIILGIKVLWDSFASFNFWGILFFILCLSFIFGMNLLLVKKFDDK